MQKIKKTEKTSSEWLPKQPLPDGPTYLAIVKALEDDIQAGRLKSGDRLSPQRDMAKTLGIALGTVSRAYSEAARRGLVYGGGRSGTFVGERSSAPRDFTTSSPIGVEGQIDLARNYPANIDDPDLTALFARLSTYPHNQYLLRYTGAEGFARHRKAGARWMAALGVEVDKDAILPSCGAQQAIVAVLATIARTGDVVAADHLAYPGIRSICSLLGLKLVGVQSDGEGIIPKELARVADQHDITALYVVPTLNNPTNTIMSIARRKAIARLAQSKNFYVIEDDIYRALHPAPPKTFAELIPDRCFFIASISKTVCGGLRVGFVLPPESCLEALKTSLLTLVFNVSPISLEILAQIIDADMLDGIIAARRKDAATRQALAREYIGDGGSAHDPASYSVWLPMPSYWNAKSFTAAAQQLGVLVCDSSCFAIDDPPPVEAIRVCLSAADNLEVLKSGLSTLAQLLRQPPRRNDFTM